MVQGHGCELIAAPRRLRRASLRNALKQKRQAQLGGGGGGMMEPPAGPSPPASDRLHHRPRGRPSLYGEPQPVVVQTGEQPCRLGAPHHPLGKVGLPAEVRAQILANPDGRSCFSQ
jgi:hypothetical protein